MKKEFFPALYVLWIIFCFVSCYSGTPEKKEARVEGEDDAIEFFSPGIPAENLPASVDLRKLKGAFPPIFDQRNLNNCTSSAAAAALYYDMYKRQVEKPFIPSRLFIYYNERKIEGRLHPSQYGDRGAKVKLNNSIKALQEYGFCAEATWPFETGKIYDIPPSRAYDLANENKQYDFWEIKNELYDLKSCLAEGYPLLFGFFMYKSFESAETRQSGIVAMPLKDEKKLGGHAALVVGYDEARQLFIFRNSFGPGWGDYGYGYIPFDFMIKYGFNFWVIKKQDEGN